MSTGTPRDPDRLLADLNRSQREAVATTAGPLAIVAGAGSGKTRVISRRAAYAIETGAVPQDQILLVTFTDKAAGEMVERMRSLGHPGVMARTFHAAALAQLRHFWPSRHDGDPLPGTLESKARLLAPLARRLPGGYRFTPPRDLADTIEWAKVRRIEPREWETQAPDRAPIPADLFARLYRDYERAKARAGVLDFEDMLVRTVELLESDAEARSIVQSRKRWLSVDEYQDTNPLAERLLELWLGQSRDLAVVGDPDQTIYTFTGATPEFLLGFEARHPGAGVVTLAENYRSSPQILELAARVGGRTLVATQPDGPIPAVGRFLDRDAEVQGILAWIRSRLDEGVAPSEIAVLVRMNAQLPPIEDALRRADIRFTLRGGRFFDRREVRDALRLLRRVRPAEVGAGLPGAIEVLLVDRLGLNDLEAETGREAQERAASLELLVGVVEDLAADDGGLTIDRVLDELARREAAEADRSGEGVNLLTYHRAKGLEWDAVYLPSLDEGILPIRQAERDEEIAEERRLLYVGITRARRFLALSSSSRRPSRFLDPILAGGRCGGGVGGGRGGLGGGRDGVGGATGPKRARVRVLPGAPIAQAEGSAACDALLEALRTWRRERAAADSVPAFVVAHDTTLAEIAELRPRTLSALRRVRGMGPVKLERYGDEILAVIVAAG